MSPKMEELHKRWSTLNRMLLTDAITIDEYEIMSEIVQEKICKEMDKEFPLETFK